MYFAPIQTKTTRTSTKASPTSRTLIRSRHSKTSLQMPELTRAKQPNIVTNTSANAISKALSRFILNRGEDITSSNVLSRLAFSYFKPGEYTEQIQQNIAVD